ncbi:MAG TPA: CAP domain-containing protein, partial [Chloroflexota bacterium]|nr:CAP domain-containing protein [Chloroflexota bacterium]
AAVQNGRGMAELEAALLERVNADRAAHGLRPVVLDAQLLGTARARAADQVGAAALSHDDAAGPLAFRRRLREAGVVFSLAGENLARPRVAPGAGAAQVAANAETALMASATHRENILEPRFDRMAVGAARGADGQVVFAQIFRAG